MFGFISKLFAKKREKENFLPKEQTPKPTKNRLPLFLQERDFKRFFLNDYFKYRVQKYKFDWLEYDNDFYFLNFNHIYFINISENKEYEKKIIDNISLIRELAKSKGRDFVHRTDKLNSKVDYDFSYYFPFFDQETIQEPINILYNHFDKDVELLKFIGYDGNIKTGFLSVLNSTISFIGIAENESIEDFVSLYFENLQQYDPNPDGRIFYSVGKKKKGTEETEPNIEIDEETQETIDRIRDDLMKLKKSGHFFAVAPILETMVKSIVHENCADERLSKELSKIVIDKDYKIILPDYHNKEIKLGHLTKAIYILFLKHSEGIDLKQISDYENELFEIYKSISYQLSYDKMKNTISELINSQNEIFVHLSRIKSTFISNFSDYYAKFYYVQGKKGKPKCILISGRKEKVVFEI